MTFTEIVDEIMDMLNFTSTDAENRIGRRVNQYHRRLTASLGLDTSRRVRVTQEATIGDRDVVFEGIEKLGAVLLQRNGKDLPLKEITHFEMIEARLRDEPPAHYSIVTTGDSSVTIRLDCVPVTEFEIFADGLATTADLTGSDLPLFPESFHDILLYGPLSDEYKKLEKVELAADAKMHYEQRLSDLRMFIAKSAYLDQYQGKHASRLGWWDTKRRP